MLSLTLHQLRITYRLNLFLVNEILSKIRAQGKSFNFSKKQYKYLFFQFSLKRVQLPVLEFTVEFTVGFTVGFMTKPKGIFKILVVGFANAR